MKTPTLLTQGRLGAQRQDAKVKVKIVADNTMHKPVFDMNKLTFFHSKNKDGKNTLTVKELPHVVVTGDNPIGCVRLMAERLEQMAVVTGGVFVPVHREKPSNTVASARKTTVTVTRKATVANTRKGAVVSRTKNIASGKNRKNSANNRNGKNTWNGKNTRNNKNNQNNTNSKN